MLAALALSAALAGCNGPCQTLADRICACEPNRTEEQSCQLTVQMRSNLPVSQAEAQVCSDLLDTCDCDALAREDYAACGLANPGGS